MSWASRQVAAARRLMAAAGWREDFDALTWEAVGTGDASLGQQIRLVFTGGHCPPGELRQQAWELHVGGRTEFVGTLEAAFVLAEIRKGEMS